MDKVIATIIRKVIGIGSGAGNTMAMVHCEVDDGVRHTLAFDPADATRIVSAFASSANHLLMKQVDQSPNNELKINPMKVDSITTYRTTDRETGEPAGAFKISTKSEANLFFTFDPAIIPGLIASLEELQNRTMAEKEKGNKPSPIH